MTKEAPTPPKNWLKPTPQLTSHGPTNSASIQDATRDGIKAVREIAAMIKRQSSLGDRNIDTLIAEPGPVEFWLTTNLSEIQFHCTSPRNGSVKRHDASVV